MARYEFEQAQRDVAELGVMLRAWYHNRDSDSVRIQNLRSSELHTAGGLTDRLVYDVQPEWRLRLTVGDMAIRGTRFDKGAYDFYTPVPKKLEPATTLNLERVEEYGDPRTRIYQRYVGSYAVVTELPEIAKTLCEGGELAIIEAAIDRAA